MKPLCIYHGNCDDGFGAAWAVRHATGAAFDFHPGSYGHAPPDVAGRHVLLVDFSYKRPVLLEMAEKALSVTILDHHKTAAEDLAGFREPPPWSEWHEGGHCPLIKAQDEVISALFDMKRSGAGLAWDFFHEGQERPLFIDYIEDRDLWLKQRPGGDEFTIALRSYPQDFEVWDGLVKRGAISLVEEGISTQRYYRLRVEELKRSAYEATIAGVTFWIANAPYFAASEVAGELAEKTGFGACYFEVSQGRWAYSLRSRTDCDVSEIAKIFGGGGHKNAAGFSAAAPVHEVSA
jgi:hypothetical protein